MQLFVGAKAIIHYDGKILLLRESSEYLDGFETGKWDVPGGRIESEEEIRDGLVREVIEECGLTVVPGEILGVFDGFPIIRGEKCHVVRVYFLCKAQSNDIVLSTDHDAYDWIDPSAVGDKVLMNDIEEMLQLAQQKL